MSLSNRKCFNCLCCYCSGLICPHFQFFRNVIPKMGILNKCLRCMQYNKNPVYDCSFFLNRIIKRYKVKRKSIKKGLSIQEIIKLRDMLTDYIDKTNIDK